MCELIDVPFDEVPYWSAGVNHQAWVLRWERAGREPVSAAGRAHRGRIRSCDAGCASTCTAGSGYYPTETSEHSSEYVPWYLHHPTEVDRLRLNVGEYVGISEANLAEYHAGPRASSRHTDTPRDRSGSTEYAPQVIHSLETGTVRVISANVANDGLITNLPDGFAVEVPDAAGRTGRASDQGR